jgi:hypothetical protein
MIIKPKKIPKKIINLAILCHPRPELCPKLPPNQLFLPL